MRHGQVFFKTFRGFFALPKLYVGITLTCYLRSLPMLSNGIREVFFPSIFSSNSVVKKPSNSEDETLHFWTQCLYWQNFQARICGETQGLVGSQIRPPFSPTKTTQVDDGDVETPAATHGQPVQVCFAICRDFGQTKGHSFTCALNVVFHVWLEPLIASLLFLWTVGQVSREILRGAKEKVQMYPECHR